MESASSTLFGTKILLAALLHWTFIIVQSCPANKTVLNFCKCEDSFSGIVLQCDGSVKGHPVNPTAIFKALRDNRLELGIIQQLSVQNTTLATLAGHLFDGLYIKKLDLSNNLIENISSDALDGLENVLQILILANNSLKMVPFEALSKNNLVSLVQLDLSGNKIGDLDQESQEFVGLPRLTDLNLSGNNICGMRRDVFTNVKDTLLTLNLGRNCLRQVPASAVRGFRQLLALHMHDNQIEELGSLQFMNMPSLNLINLAHNRIRTIHPKSFLNVPNLRFIYLSDNNLTEIEPYQFRTFERLEMLDLTRNRLQSLSPYSFAELPRLSQLYLGDNEIWRLEPNAFVNSTLVVLLLAGNRLTSLTPDMFNGLSYLQQLSLKNNKISGIAPTAFYQMPGLVVLDLSDNQLIILQPATFLAQLSLFLLDLSNNKLVTVPYNAFNQRIASILLRENPVVCTERVQLVQNGVGVFLPEEPNNICSGNRDSTDAQQKPAQSSFIQSPSDSQIIEKTTNLINSSTSNFFNKSAPNNAPVSLISPIIQAIRSPPTQQQRSPNQSISGKNIDPVVQFPINRVISITPSNSWHLDEEIDVSTFPPQSPVEAQFGQSSPVPVTGIAHVSEEDESNPKGAPVGQQETLSPAVEETAVDDGLIRIPFRTNRPIIGPAFAIGPAFTLPANFAPIAQVPGDETYTLPPGVILATIPQWTTPFKINRPKTTTSSSVDGEPRINENAPASSADSDLSRISFYPPKGAKNRSLSSATDDLPQIVYKTPAPKKTQDSVWSDAATGVGADSDPNVHSGHSSGATTIAVCLTVVVVVLVGVFVTLCAVRHRSRKSQRSASSRTSAYVAAQAAQLQYATMGYRGSVDPNTVNMHSGLSRYYHAPQAQQQQQQQQQSWLYGPNAIYASASQYYK